MEVYRLQNQSFPIRIKFNKDIQCLTVEAAKELARELNRVTGEKLVHADLVDKLIGYAVHDDGCQINTPLAIPKCTCGLSDKIREVRGE